jgi:AAA domain
MNDKEVDAIFNQPGGELADPDSHASPYLGPTRMRRLPQVTDEIEVASVNSYQGRERDNVIVSLVNTDHIGFLEDPK